MSKSTVLTLPVVCLLLDLWPLRRIKATTVHEAAAQFRGLVWEKVPMLALGLGVSLIGVVGQRSIGALPTWADFPLGGRIANAVLAYGAYFRQTFWPAGLAAYYPYPKSFNPVQVLIVTTGLLVMTAWIVWRRRQYPFLAVGWGWYIITLAPMIGLIQIGGHARADRYTYVPLFGLLIGAVWWVVAVWPNGRHRNWSLGLLAGTVVFLCGVRTQGQIATWDTSEKLWRHTLAVTRLNELAHNNLGTVLARSGRIPEAIEQFRQAVTISPNHAEAQLNLGLALLATEQPGAALPVLETAVRLMPREAAAHAGLAEALGAAGRRDEAIAHWNIALDLRPSDVELRSRIGLVLASTGQFEAAARAFQTATELKPEFDAGYANLGTALLKLGRLPQAVDRFEACLRINPSNAQAHAHLGVALTGLGRLAEAAEHLRIALKLRPDDAESRANLERLEAAVAAPPK